MPASLTIPACCPDQVRELASELGLQRVTAEVLVRRGLGDAGRGARVPRQRRARCTIRSRLGDMAEACALIESAIADGRRIVVHGDYDVDGVCATALAVEVLRLLGAEVEPFLPSRFEHGYGVAVATVEALAAGGAGLLITVDCGIAAPEAVARARELGLDVVVTDHHRPGDVLPDAPIVASRVPSGAGYPFADLCGTGVVLKLAQALWSRAHGGDPAALPPALDQLSDLVALATVADVVPLARREPRARAARAAAARRGRAPGTARADVERRRRSGAPALVRPQLPPRAAHQRRRPARRPASSRSTCCSRPRAPRPMPLAEQLEERNRERQGVEDAILRAAVAEIERSGALERGDRVLVAAGRGLARGRDRHRRLAPRRPPRAARSS